jgi:hypothetical protein
MFMPLPFASLASLGSTFPHPAAFFPNPTAASQHGAFLFPSSSFFYHQQPPKPHQSVLKTNNNNNRYAHNNNNNGDVYSKRYILDAILRSQQSPSGGSTSRDDDEEEDEEDEDGTLAEGTPPKHQSAIAYSTNKRTVLNRSRVPVSPHHEELEQENPMDLSMKSCQEEDRLSSPMGSVDDELTDQEDEGSRDVPVKDTEHDTEYDSMASDHKERHSLSVVAPMDLTTRA